MKNKKALSEVIGYTLLVILGITIAGMVGVWLRMQVPSEETGNTCPEETSLIIQDYKCTVIGSTRYLNITIKNKGFFSVDGFVLKYTNAESGKIGLYNLGNESNNPESIYGKRLAPEETFNFKYNLATNTYLDQSSYQCTDPNPLNCWKIYLLDLQPFTIYQGEKNYCLKVSYKDIDPGKACY